MTGGDSVDAGAPEGRSITAAAIGGGDERDPSEYRQESRSRWSQELGLAHNLSV
jgi:hypothetical protein